MTACSPGTRRGWRRGLGWLNGGVIDEVLHGGRRELEDDSGVYAGSGLDSLHCSTKTTTVKTMDRLRGLLGVDGYAGARRRSGVLLGRRRKRRGRRRRKLWRGNGTGRLLGVSRRQEVARGRAPGRLVAWRPPGWLGGIPPSSLGAREVEEDPPAPGGPGGLAGPASPGRQVRFFYLFFV